MKHLKLNSKDSIYCNLSIELLISLYIILNSGNVILLILILLISSIALPMVFGFETNFKITLCGHAYVEAH